MSLQLNKCESECEETKEANYISQQNNTSHVHLEERSLNRLDASMINQTDNNREDLEISTVYLGKQKN